MHDSRQAPAVPQATPAPATCHSASRFEALHLSRQQLRMRHVQSRLQALKAGGLGYASKQSLCHHTTAQLTCKAIGVAAPHTDATVSGQQAKVFCDASNNLLHACWCNFGRQRQGHLQARTVQVVLAVCASLQPSPHLRQAAPALTTCCATSLPPGLSYLSLRSNSSASTVFAVDVHRLSCVLLAYRMQTHASRQHPARITSDMLLQWASPQQTTASPVMPCVHACSKVASGQQHRDM